MGTDGKYKNDSLGTRMKAYYEDRTRILLTRRTYTILRVDGKAFHTYTKGLKKPFDEGLIDDMDWTARYLCENIMGAKLAYVQSDEISILVTDFEDITTDAWFNNNLQKMASISAAMATAKFNQMRLQRYFSGPENNIVPENQTRHDIGEHYVAGTNLEDVRDDIASFVNYMPHKWDLPIFDSRVFQIPQKVEVENYFIWRQQDATRNSIASVAQSLYSHKELNGKNSDQQQELIFQKGLNWNDFPIGQKRGRIIEKVTFVNGKDIRTIPNQEISLGLMDGNKQVGPADVVRTKWVVAEPPVFTQDRMFLFSRIPNNN